MQSSSLSLSASAVFGDGGIQPLSQTYNGNVQTRMMCDVLRPPYSKGNCIKSPSRRQACVGVVDILFSPRVPPSTLSSPMAQMKGLFRVLLGMCYYDDYDDYDYHSAHLHLLNLLHLPIHLSINLRRPPCSINHTHPAFRVAVKHLVALLHTDY